MIRRLLLLCAFVSGVAFAQNNNPCQQVTNKAASGQILSASGNGQPPPCTWIVNSGGGGGGGTPAVSNVTPVTASANVTSAQVLQQLNLPVAYLNTIGAAFTYDGSGIYSAAAGQTPTLTWTLNACTVSGCGSGTVRALAVVVSPNVVTATNNTWNMRLATSTTATGATGTLITHGTATVQLTSGSDFGTSSSDSNTASSAAIDLTGAVFLQLTVTTSTGDAGNSITEDHSSFGPGSGGGGGGGTITSVTLAGTTNQITATGTCTGTTTISCTLSLPSGLILPGTVNGLTITTTTGTLTVTGAKALTVNNSLTLAGTDGVTLTFPSTNATIARTDASQAFAGTQSFTGTLDGSGAAHTLPSKVVATIGALPGTCTAGELAIVTGATLGQQIYECSTGNVWTQQVTGGLPAGTGPVVVNSGIGTAVQTGQVTACTTGTCLAQFPNVKDYGAKCDGTTNDAAAFQAAHDAISFGTIYMPAGTCVINSNINVTKDNITWTGTGLSTQLKMGASVTKLFNVTNGTSTALVGAQFFNFEILGGLATGGTGILFDGVRSGVISNVNTFQAFISLDFEQTHVTCSNNTLDTFIFQDTPDGANARGILINGALGGLAINNGQIYEDTATTANIGVEIKSLSGLILNNLDIELYGTAFKIDPPASKYVRDAQIHSLQTDTSNSTNLIIDGSAAVGGGFPFGVYSLNFTNCWSASAGVGGAGTGYGIDVVESFGVVFDACQIYNNSNDGVRIRAASNHTTISNSQIAGNSQASSGVNSGVLVDTGADSFIIAGNIVGAIGYSGTTQQYGVNLAGSAQNYVVTGNNFDNNATGPYHDTNSPATGIQITGNIPSSINTSGAVTSVNGLGGVVTVFAPIGDATQTVKCDGTTDDTSAWNTLLAVAGSTIESPKGCISIATNLTVTADGITLHGNGTTIKTKTGTTGIGLFINNHPFTMNGMTLDCNSITGVTNCMEADTGTLIAQNNTIKNVGTPGISNSQHGLVVFSSINNVITGNTFNNTSGYAIQCNTCTHTSITSNNITKAYKNGIVITGGSYVNVTGNVIDHVYDYGGSGTGASGNGVVANTSSTAVTVNNNNISYTEYSGIRFAASSGNNASGNTINYAGDWGIYCADFASSNNNCSSNTIPTSLGGGIVAANAGDNMAFRTVVSGNSIGWMFGSGTNGTSSGQFANGILLDGYVNATGNTVAGALYGIVCNNQESGVFSEVGCTASDNQVFEGRPITITLSGTSGNISGSANGVQTDKVYLTSGGSLAAASFSANVKSCIPIASGVNCTSPTSITVIPINGYPSAAGLTDNGPTGNLTATMVTATAPENYNVTLGSISGGAFSLFDLGHTGTGTTRADFMVTCSTAVQTSSMCATNHYVFSGVLNPSGLMVAVPSSGTVTDDTSGATATISANTGTPMVMSYGILANNTDTGGCSIKFSNNDIRGYTQAAFGGIAGSTVSATIGGGTCYQQAVPGAYQVNGINSTLTVASGTSALGTTLIASGACASAVTGTATNALTTDNLVADFSMDPTSTTGYSPSANGMLTIIKYVTANTANFKVCNNTASGVTPGAVTLQWRVVR